MTLYFSEITETVFKNENLNKYLERRKVDARYIIVQIITTKTVLLACCHHLERVTVFYRKIYFTYSVYGFKSNLTIYLYVESLKYWLNMFESIFYSLGSSNHHSFII